jgi:DNA-binding transcriptional regulator YiaG
MTEKKFQATPASIRKRREELGMTQAECAERLGVPVETVIGWESGELPMNESMLLIMQRYAREHGGEKPS